MKQLFALLLSLTLLASCKESKTEREKGYDRKERDDYRNDDKDKSSENASYTDSEDWSSGDVRKFNKECLSDIAKNNEEFADKFCPCLLNKMQAKFSSYSEMDTKGTEAEGKRLAEDCIESLGLGKNNSKSSSSNWTSADVDLFVNSCVNSAVDRGMKRTQAENYCNCMQEKIEEMYPDTRDAAALNSDAMETPSMKRLVKDCRADN